MKRLTLGLAAATALSCAAVAQTTAPAQTPSSAPASTTAPQRSDAAHPIFQMKQGEWRSSKLIGLNVYNGDDKIGDINEVIVGKDGKIDAVVVGVGGFLGMGEHDVAVPFDKVKFLEEPRRTADRTARSDTRPAGTAPAPTTTTATNAERRDATTTGTVATNPPARDSATRTDTYRGYPDHAEVAMSKDQLKALPQVRYNR